jgi:hypothetical protein
LGSVLKAFFQSLALALFIMSVMIPISFFCTVSVAYEAYSRFAVAFLQRLSIT